MKQFLIDYEGFELAIINEEELEILKKTDTHNIVVKEISFSLNTYLENIKNGIKLFKFSYNFETDNFLYKKIKDIKDIKLSYINEYYESENYLFLNLLNFIENEEELKNKFLLFKNNVKHFLEMDMKDRDDFLTGLSDIKYPNEIEIPDNHPKRTKKLEKKSKLMLEQLKHMIQH